METHEEHHAASELVRHAAWLRRLALALVGDVAAADDVVQETYVAALSHPPSGGLVPRSWLARVARNAARQTFRSQGRRARREAKSSGPAALPGPRETVERLDAERCLTDELARLDEPFRTALLLRYYDGLSPAEIATRTETPGGTVRWRLQRGLALLRERLDGRFGERSAWCALLLPIARSQPPLAAGTAASMSILQGVLTMSATWKLGAALVCVVAITIGLVLSGVLPTSAPLAREEPLEVAFRPEAPPLARAPAPPVTLEPPAPEGSVRAAVAAAPSVPPPAAEPRHAPARVEARVVDAAGRALEGVELRRLDGPGPVALSAPDGQIALSVEVDDQPRGIPLEFRLRHHASHGATPVLLSGQVATLGTVVLGPGGAVSGRVVDVAGKGVAGATVVYQAAIETSLELEKKRVAGGFESVPSARTDAQGGFELAGLGTGFVRILAEAPGFLAGFTPPVEVRSGQETFGVELALEALPAENTIRGVVLGADGSPVPHAVLEFRHDSRTSGTATIGDWAADAEGRFEFRLLEDARLWLTARDPADLSVSASVADVPTGGPELVLRLARGPRIELVVTDERGAVEQYAYSLLSADQTSVQQREPRAPRPGGKVDFQRPVNAFVVQIDAPGHLREVLGPFEPAHVATSLEARLVAVPGLRGRVRLGPDGPPAAGARVSLHELVADDAECIIDGFHSRLEKDVADETVCDEDGEFLLTARRASDYVVRAERDGYAPAESDTITVRRDLGAPQIELELSSGGVIEGRVRRADGADPAGTILGLTRGDGLGRTVRAGLQGRYRIERLTPGPWWLEVRSEELIPGNSTTIMNTGGKPRGPGEPTCLVFEGETTWHDLELGGAALCALEGCLRVDAAPAQAWEVRLIPHERPFFEDESNGIGLDVDGCFRVETEQPGTYWLVLSGAFEQHGDQVLVDVVELGPGVERWEHGFSTGTLVVDGAAAWTGEEVPVCVHHWDGPGELFALTVISGDETGVARVPSIPAGPARLVRPDAENFEFAKWPTLLEVEVPAGGEARVRLPE